MNTCKHCNDTLYTEIYDTCMTCFEKQPQPTQTMTTTNSEQPPLKSAATCSPFWYGIGALFATPVIALLLILMSVLMILAWPFIPFLCYMQKKEEISKANGPAEVPAPTC